MLTHPRWSPRVAMLAALVAVPLVAVACGDDDNVDADDATSSIRGNVAPAEASDYDSVGFIFDGEHYHFFAAPDMTWTRIIGVDQYGSRALVWSRDDDASPYDGSFLDLDEMEFSPIIIDNVDGFFARGLTDDGRVVGGATTSEDGDERIYGVVHDPDGNGSDDDTVRIEQPGTEFTGIADVSVSGAVLGYTDGGMSTFVADGDRTVEVHGDGSNRLLGSQMNSDGVVVGYASWGDDPMWAPLPRGFVARPDGDDSYLAQPFSLSGMSRTSITGINDAGRIAGSVHEQDDGPMVAYSADVDDPDATVTLHHLPDEVTDVLSTPGTGADVSGIDEAGRVFGTVFLTDPEPELWEDEPACGGHGHLHGDDCHCDDGYQQDPDDPAMCILERD